MTTAIPPACKIAAPQWETVTVEDLWVLSDATGVPACTIFATAQQLVGRDA